ncbi:hypothetical protein CMI47_10725 [Candidatus Pacearchaeota archaeon]|nr:hypothetical protein [Candidatus Pacearchaeota archaeon]|tara:strand:+ start:1966 stop:2895 length:930 start_codon:yes stop_codon:yes gene_type:complete
MAKRKFSDLGLNPNFPNVQDLIDQGVTVNKVPAGSGLMNTPNTPISTGYQTPPGAYPINNMGASIMVGAIPPMGLSSGFGAPGANVPTVDLVVGRAAAARKGQGPTEGSVVDNNFGTDAARIYISRLTDIDRHFGLAGQASANANAMARSAVAIKADGVRIIGREGVKIVTGKMKGGAFGPHGETNSLGGRVESPAPKIELIAGNNYDIVQGVALGEKTRDSLRELHEILQDLWSAVYNFITLQTGWDGVVGVSPLPHYPAGAAPKSMGNMTMVMSSLYSTRVNLMTWNHNYTSPTQDTYIVSRNVRTN